MNNEAEVVENNPNPEIIERGRLLDMVWANEAGVSVRVYEGTNERRVIEIVSGVGSADEFVFGKATIEKHNRQPMADLFARATPPTPVSEPEPCACTHSWWSHGPHGCAECRCMLYIGGICSCTHGFDRHAKPAEGVPWDICSFPCLECDCQEFNVEDRPASPPTVPACVLCGHRSVDREGRCVFEYRRLNIPNDVRYCGCKCEFPTAQVEAEVPAERQSAFTNAVENEVNKMDDFERLHQQKQVIETREGLKRDSARMSQLRDALFDVSLQLHYRDCLDSAPFSACTGEACSRSRLLLTEGYLEVRKGLDDECKEWRQRWAQAQAQIIHLKTELALSATTAPAPVEDEKLREIRERLQKATPGPWFVAHDDAKECGPHVNSGLALVDTGRVSDWPIARLCYWPTAEFIANAPADIDYLLTRLSQAEAQRQSRLGQSDFDREYAKGIVSVLAKALNRSGEAGGGMAGILSSISSMVAELTAQMESLTNLVSEAAPLAWVANTDMDGAREWEVKSRTFIAAAAEGSK